MVTDYPKMTNDTKVARLYSVFNDTFVTTAMWLFVIVLLLAYPFLELLLGKRKVILLRRLAIGCGAYQNYYKRPSKRASKNYTHT